jgi:hypothetical protein
VLVTLAALLVVTFLAWLMFQLVSLAGEVRANEAKLAAGRQRDAILQAQNDRQDRALEEANRRLKAAGKATVPVPTAPAIPGPQGPAGQSATAMQVAAAIASYCAVHTDCMGSQGPQGERGATGTAGAKGDTGAMGATGAQGPAGETGATGPAGADGKDGRSAYPFEFRFTIQFNPEKSTTFTCTLTAPDVVADCTASEG